MIRTRDTVQGDLIDPNTGARLVARIPPWFGAAALASSTTVMAPLAAPAPLAATPMSPKGVWTESGYLPPYSFPM